MGGTGASIAEPKLQLPGSMRAAWITKVPSIDLEIMSTEVPTTSDAKGLLVRVEACGICGTDLHLMNGESFRPKLPFILGHEPVGTVIAAGSPQLSSWLGKRVTLTIFKGCGECEFCRSGDERLCLSMQSITGLISAPGGYAEYLSIPAANALEIPESLSSTLTASLVDAGPTAVNAVATALDRGPRKVVVVGGGPVGFLVSELLRLQSVDVVVVEPNHVRRQALAQIRHQVAPHAEEITGPAPDAIIDCSGSNEVIPWALSALRPHGTIVAVGFPTLKELEVLPIVRRELMLRGVRSGSRQNLVEILTLAAENRIELPKVATWPLERINHALKSMRLGQVPGKAVVEIGKSDADQVPSDKNAT